jgi:predicted nucleotidyltransferase
MTFQNENPTPYPVINALLRNLLEGARAILGEELTGMYLEGSLASGDFDQDSDIDFVAVTRAELPHETFLALRAMHERINLLDTYWSINLEGSYVSEHALRCYDPAHARFPNIERGLGERLKMVATDETWIIHRHLLREHGITLFGPDPKTLIDPVAPDDLRRAMYLALQGWAAHILDHPDEIIHQGYQSYCVLTVCRILYTLRFGEVVSKHTAARWAGEDLGEPWRGLIGRAWDGRQHPQDFSSVEDKDQTLQMIRFALAYAEEHKASQA